MSPVRLAGQDAYFLYRETAGALMHTLKVAICEPPDPLPGRESLLASVESRLHLLPPLRRRLVPVPLALHHPVWIEDPAFDLGWHLRHATLPAPGGPRELDALVGEIASHALDRSRPLWELWIVEGLAGGRIAYVLKLHHAVADGVATAALISHSAERDPAAEPPPPERPWEPEPVPGALRLLVDALRDHLRQIAHLPVLLRRTLRGSRAARRRRGEARVKPPAMWDAPKLRFNHPLEAKRIYASATLPLEGVRRVKDALGVSVNDVVLALCAGALRRDLAARGELSERALNVSVPVSADPAGGGLRLAGNRVAYLLTALPTHIADPVERVHAVHEVTAEAKLELELGGRDLVIEWMEYLPPLPYTWLRRAHSRLRLADSFPTPSNLVVSNVPGPRETLYWSGNELVELYSIGPLSEGIGLNFTVWSYRDSLHVAALACDAQVPELPEIVASLPGELARLEEAVDSAR